MRRLVSLLCLLATAPALAEIVWKSGFETGGRSEWSSTQMVSVDRLLVVSKKAGAPVREGDFSLKATVIQGDNPIKASGNRNELIKMTRESEGSEYWYKWSVRFGSTFPSERTWQLFTQWHHEGNNGSPPVEFYVYGEEIRFHLGGDPGVTVWRTPLKRGVWYDFVLRARWSPDPKKGLVELYLDGKQVLAPLAIATQYKGMRNYLKAGLYRNDTIKAKGTLYLDGFVMATSRDDVLPPVKPAPTVPPVKADAATPPVDAGTKANADAGTPARPDAGVDAGRPVTGSGTPDASVCPCECPCGPKVDGGTPLSLGTKAPATSKAPLVESLSPDAQAIIPPVDEQNRPPVEPRSPPAGGCASCGGAATAMAAVFFVRRKKLAR